jgi:hypothetical protein
MRERPVAPDDRVERIEAGFAHEKRPHFAFEPDTLGVSYGNVDAELTSRGVDAQDALRLAYWWQARFLADVTEFDGISDRAKNDPRLVATYGAGLGRLYWDAQPRGFSIPFTDHINRLLAEADKHAGGQQ